MSSTVSQKSVVIVFEVTSQKFEQTISMQLLLKESTSKY